MPTSRDALIIAILFLIPGFVADAVLTKQFERQKREVTELILNVLMLTLINYAICGYFLLRLDDQASVMGYTRYIRTYRGWCLTVAVLVLFVAPVVEAVIIGRFAHLEWGRRLLHAVLNIKLKDPKAPPTVWDHVFKPDRGYLLIATLTDGSKVAGGFGNGSRVSTHPEEQEIYLEVTFYVDEDGRIGLPIPLSQGVLLKRSDIRSLEFFRISEGGIDERQETE